MKHILVVILMVSVGLSCTKEEAKKTETTLPKCTAGQGGNVTLVACPKHHGKEVRPYFAYVKFGSKELPGTQPANFDLVVAADTTENHIELKNLKCGDYYIFMKGYDTIFKEAVVGGIPYTIAETATGEIDINVPVTE